MKKILERIIFFILKRSSAHILHRFKPEIIAVTGSYGKTSTCRAIRLVLSKKYKLPVSVPEGYNTEIGAPLSVLSECPRSRWDWSWIVPKVILKSIFIRSYYEKVVVEMGADKPGDISYLTSFIRPDKSVVTSIGPVHLGSFGDVDGVAREKSFLVKALKKNGTAFLNYDEARTRNLSKETKAEVVYFGVSNNADVWASDVSVSLAGTSFVLNIKGGDSSSFKIKVFGEHNIYSILAAAVVGYRSGIGLEEMKEALVDYSFPKGRMNLIKGLNDSYIIDDSYNASPRPVMEALKTLDKIAPKRKVAVLGDMLDLGDYSESGHKEVGEVVSKNADVLITVGRESETIAKSAEKNGMPKKSIKSFSSTKDASEFVKKIILPKDAVLVKGSQDIRLEKVVSAIMKEPERAGELLVRQDRMWQKK